ncbi:MAG: A/G-specific adenine glycosylase [Nitrospinae bacterium CG11_big_fil_rev_8_21_14_0_20_45_15]|nr:MAG: A/G-specific adenine glycosylase [Nitrospinae bacterium CG11_big_fil_rev_8_21_14_0_20_45_15]
MSDTFIIQKSLLCWYRKERRDLPWRRSQDPYAIWVSEIMLQQTQVKTVLPYFDRWMKAFPTVEDLASAPESKVLKLWEGLGYYSRAKNLKKAAGLVRDQYAGRLPSTRKEILALPGIGPYTAGAILSIAFGMRAPVLDGNVKRVLSRLLRLNENGKTSKSEKILWAEAERLLPEEDVGDFNQALMELGAQVCLPQKPQCMICPLKKICQAFLQADVENFPPPKPQPVIQKIEVSAAVLFQNGKVYIQQRVENGLMAGLWEFPGGKIEEGESPEECIVREIREELGPEMEIEEKMTTIRHSYTQFRVTLHVFKGRLLSDNITPTACQSWKWVLPKKLVDYPFPSANVKIIKLLQ